MVNTLLIIMVVNSISLLPETRAGTQPPASISLGRNTPRHEQTPKHVRVLLHPGSPHATRCPCPPEHRSLARIPAQTLPQRWDNHSESSPPSISRQRLPCPRGNHQPKNNTPKPKPNKQAKTATQIYRQDAFLKALLQICKLGLDYCQGAVVKESLQITHTLGQL